MFEKTFGTFLSLKLEPEIKEILKLYLGIPYSQFDYLYRFFREEFFRLQWSGPKNPDHDNLTIDQLKNFEPLSTFNSYSLKEVTHLGVDLPVWFLAPKESRKKVMLLAMDPYRSGEKWQKGKADINSPFSLHARPYNQYYHGIHLLSMNFDLYITDIYKVFFRPYESSNHASNGIEAFTSLEIHKKILENEIRVFNPDLIVCFGKHPANKIASIGNFDPPGPLPKYLNPIGDINGKNVFAFPHPSGLASRWSQSFLKNNDLDLTPGRYMHTVVNAAAQFSLSE